MVTQFYQMMKKRGFSETLHILGGFENKEAVQSKFFEKFEEENSYYNAYLRVKNLLLERGLIKFKLNNHDFHEIYFNSYFYSILSMKYVLF